MGEVTEPIFFMFAEELVRALVIGLSTAGIVVLVAMVIAIFRKPPPEAD